MPPLPIGIEDIDRKYEILDKMGEGGMGEVYKARHTLLDEIRVIKTIRSSLADDADLRARFFREARVATRLRHPNVAAIYDFSVGDDGTACIVMEYVDGGTLADRLRQGRRPSLAETVEIGCQTLDALDALHRNQVVHRDVSPDNIMLTRDDRGGTQVKLIDLGIAKPLDGLEGDAQFQTATAMFIGKVRYASPEQLGGGGGGGIDGRSDLYSLAVVLYELLTGALPVTGTDPKSLIAGHLFHPPKSFAETDPRGEVPEALRRVLLRALAKDREERFPTAEAFAAALRGALEGGAELDPTVLAPETLMPPTVLAGTELPATALAPAETATPATAPEVTAAPAPAARPRRWWLAAAVALLVVLGAAGAWWLATRGGEEEPAGDAVAAALAGLDFGTYRAVVVGNDNYSALPGLETAVRDAREVARVLEERYGFQVRLITDADRGELITGLNEVAREAGPLDHLLVYYAGHGTLVNESGYWQLVDADPLDTSNWVHTRYDVGSLLDGSAARHVLVVADSCYAGAMGDGGSGVVDEVAGAGGLRQRVEELLARRSRLVLTSGSLEPVLDSGDGHGTHSVFAAAFLAALGDNDGLLRTPQLHADLRQRVEGAAAELGIRQMPGLAPIPASKHDGGDFFFLPAELRAAITAPAEARR